MAEVVLFHSVLGLRPGVITAAVAKLATRHRSWALGFLRGFRVGSVFSTVFTCHLMTYYGSGMICKA